MTISSIATTPSFVLDASLFDEPAQYPVHHEISPTCCHVGRHVDFSSIQISLVTRALKV